MLSPESNWYKAVGSFSFTVWWRFILSLRARETLQPTLSDISGQRFDLPVETAWVEGESGHHRGCQGIRRMWRYTSPKNLSVNLEALKLQLARFMSELAYVLARLGISQYLESLIEEGFETWETVLDITESDL